MAFVRVPPDGAGKKIYSTTRTVGSDQVEVQGVTLADGDNPSNLIAVDQRGSASVRFAEGQPLMGVLGSLKTTNARVVGVYESSIDSYDDLFSIELIGSGSSDHEPVTSSTVLSVSGANGDAVVRTTNRYHYHLPGSSTIAYFSYAADSAKAGNVRQWGMFDDDDGVFFQLNGSGLSVVVRSSTTGSVVDTVINQANWNSDKADGTGLSGIVLDYTKANIYWIDYQWFGAGRVRFGIYEPNGSRLVLHTFEGGNLSSVPIMRTGTLPLRSVNKNTSAVGFGSTLREICAAVYVEGDFEDYSFWRSSTGVTTLPTISGPTPAGGVRSIQTINGKHNHVQTVIESVYIHTDAPIAVEFWDGVTFDPSAVWTNPTGNSFERTFSPLMSTVGAELFHSAIVGTGTTQLRLDYLWDLNDEAIQRAADGSPEQWGFIIKPLSGSATPTVAFNYRELW